MENKIKLSGKIREIPIEKKRTWICYYINSKGDEREKVFYDMEEGLAFTRKLDERIERKTCGGYSFMEL